jgi:hypothetical protein
MAFSVKLWRATRSTLRTFGGNHNLCLSENQNKFRCLVPASCSGMIVAHYFGDRLFVSNGTMHLAIS